MKWVDIIGLNGDYLLSDQGDVKSFVRKEPMIMKKTLNSKGYVQYHLSSNGRKHNLLLSRLLAIHFIPNPNNYPYVNHKDGNPLNNSLENLEWCTAKQNVRHAWDTGLCFAFKGTDNYQAKRVVAIYPDGKEKEFGSLTFAANELGIGMSNIGLVLKGTRKQIGGYKFRYPGEPYAYKPKREAVHLRNLFLSDEIR